MLSKFLSEGIAKVAGEDGWWSEGNKKVFEGIAQILVRELKDTENPEQLILDLLEDAYSAVANEFS